MVLQSCTFLPDKDSQRLSSQGAVEEAVCAGQGGSLGYEAPFIRNEPRGHPELVRRQVVGNATETT